MPSRPIIPFSTLPLLSQSSPLIFRDKSVGHMVNSQRASPTYRQRRRLFVPTHPEIASVSDSSSLEEVWKIDPIEARAVWNHEVVGAEAEGVFDGCMVELSEGLGW